MPNRILKDSVCTSDNLDALTWFEEVFFYRLIVSCDDYGRLDARPPILRARLFPLKSVTDKQIESALKSLRTAGIVCLYEVDGKPFLQLRTWERHQHIRNCKSKYPAPEDGKIKQNDECEQLKPVDINCNQLQSIDINCTRNPIQSNPNPNPNPKGALPPFPENWGAGLKEAMTNWLQYKREQKKEYKPQGLKSLITKTEENRNQYGEAAVVDLITTCMASGWQGIIWDKLEKRPKQAHSPQVQSEDQRMAEDLAWIKAYNQNRGGGA